MWVVAQFVFKGSQQGDISSCRVATTGQVTCKKSPLKKRHDGHYMLYYTV